MNKHIEAESFFERKRQQREVMNKVKEWAKEGQVYFSAHSKNQAIARNVSRDDIMNILLYPKFIKHTQRNKSASHYGKYDTYKVVGENNNRVALFLDEKTKRIMIITVMDKD